MHRREMLAAVGGCAVGLGAFPLGWAAAAEKRRPRLLYFTRSVGYEHSVVRRKGDALSHSERILTELGKEHGFAVTCTKDGGVFDGDLQQFDALVFYTCGDLTKPSVTGAPPMTARGKARLLEAAAAGKPLVGLHSSCFWPRQDVAIDPLLQVIGGQFISHGKQQKATMRVVDPGFPGAGELGRSFAMLDEWYAMKDFAPDMHVILAQQTEGMEGAMYQRPPFPSTWARMHNEGRVFFTAMGHREDVWTSEAFQSVLLGGLSWALGRVDADISPNIEDVTPRAEELPTG